MERTATCLCGQLKITLDGDPARVNMCSCTEGQIKTVEGDSSIYTRTGGSGNGIDLHFCPTCGVSVYFRPAARPAVVGVHGGCFADPGFPAPNTAGWTQDKHDWVVVPDGTNSFDRNPQ